MADSVHDQVVSYFDYWPSQALAIVALTLFILLSVVHGAITVSTRTWFALIVTVTGLLEMAGYASRISMIHKPTYGTYVAMQCFLIISPSFLSLANYLTVGKIMQLLQVKAVIKSGAVAWVFFGIELAALALQGAGAGLSVSNEGTPPHESVGKAFLLVGLALQVVFLFTFVIFAIGINRKTNELVAKQQQQRRRLSRIYFGLYSTSALLSLRNIFRLIEFAQGWYGYLGTHEVFLYVFDTIPVLLCFALYIAFHFGLHDPRKVVVATQQTEMGSL